MERKKLVEAVAQWGKDKKIDNPIRQGIRMMEELGELCQAHTRLLSTKFTEQERFDWRVKRDDAVGDLLVTVIIECDIATRGELPFESSNQSLAKPDADKALAILCTDIGSFFDEVLAPEQQSDPLYFAQQAVASIERYCRYAALPRPDPWLCLQVVYNIISKREGTTEGGTFLKADETPIHRPRKE